MFTLYMLSVLGKSIIIFQWFSGSDTDLTLTNDLGGIFYTIDIWMQFLDELIMWFIIKSLITPIARSVTNEASSQSIGIQDYFSSKSIHSNSVVSTKRSLLVLNGR